MSYPGLIGDADHPQAGGEKFFDEVVFFVVEGGAAEMRDGFGLHQGLAVFGLDERFVAAFPDALGDHFHGEVLIERFPLLGVRFAVENFGDAFVVGEEFEAVGALGAEAAAGDGRFGIAFDGDQLAVLVEDQLAAADGAVGAHAAGYFGAFVFGAEVAGGFAHGFGAGAVGAVQDLVDQRPRLASYSSMGNPRFKVTQNRLDAQMKPLVPKR